MSKIKRLKVSNRAVSICAALAVVAGSVAVGSMDGSLAAQQSGGISGGSGSEQQKSETSQGVSEIVAVGAAAAPVDLPLLESHFTSSVMYRRTVGVERFDTDHDVDGANDVDREIVGSFYIIGDSFGVRIPNSYIGESSRVLGFSFNHVVFAVDDMRFTAGCGSQRITVYSNSVAKRWRCHLNFSNSESRWKNALSGASSVRVVRMWTNQGCENGEYGIETGRKEIFLIEDCKTLLAIKHYWLDEMLGNRGRLSGDHRLFSWGVGDIKNWGGVLVDNFPNDDKSLWNECSKKGDDCSPRVIVVDLGVVDDGGESEKIMGDVPGEFGDLKALVALSLYNNLLTGEIPAELGNDEAASCHKSTHVPEAYLIIYTQDLGSIRFLMMGMIVARVLGLGKIA